MDEFISTILHFQCRIKSSIQYTVQYNTIELQGKSDKRELEIANEIKRDQIEDRHFKKFRARQHTSGRGARVNGSVNLDSLPGRKQLRTIFMDSTNSWKITWRTKKPSEVNQVAC